jgi:hypothetical protein
VSTPITPSTLSASLVIAVVLPSVGSGRVGLETPRGTSVTGHNPAGWTGCSSSQQAAGQADAGTTADNSDLKATHRGQLHGLPCC